MTSGGGGPEFGPLHIAAGCDDNYTDGAMVLIASAHHHNPGLKVSILGMDLSLASRARLTGLAQALGIAMDLHEVPEARFRDVAVTRAGLTRAACLRLLLPEILQDTPRILYLDCDVLVTGPLQELWEVDLQGTLAAAVPDIVPVKEELRALNLDAAEYVNSGVMLMDLALWRAEGMGQRCLEFLCLPESGRFCLDQAAINKIGQGRFRLMERRWNFHPIAVWKTGSGPEALPPRLVHYPAGGKPWDWADAMAGDLWWAHAERMPVPPATGRPQRRIPATLRARAEAWARPRTYWVLGRDGYREGRVANRRFAAFRRAYLALLGQSDR